MISAGASREASSDWLVTLPSSASDDLEYNGARLGISSGDVGEFKQTGSKCLSSFVCWSGFRVAS